MEDAVEFVKEDFPWRRVPEEYAERVSGIFSSLQSPFHTIRFCEIERQQAVRLAQVVGGGVHFCVTYLSSFLHNFTYVFSTQQPSSFRNLILARGVICSCCGVASLHRPFLPL